MSSQATRSGAEAATRITKPRRAPAGTLYRGREGMWSWVLQRITGTAIFFFLLVHILDTALHALNGLRIICIDFFHWGPKSQRLMFWIVIALWVVLMAGFLPRQFMHIFGAE